MSVGEVAGLLAAAALVALVGFLAVPILKLGRTVDEFTLVVRDLRQEHVAKTATTVDETNELLASTNAQLQRIDAITSNAQTVTTNVAAMSSLFAATLGGPLVRTAAFTYGVRRAIAARRDGAAAGTGRRRRFGSR
ncbi:DUF948 domain-containing protein [Jiangella sp. DSM 45060]|uniref:DUF948 domain-containing protein n=1 Tax=Jiangella sp. DSM 45060 TaxID=1798224 RepID=UPI0008799DE4|nr:DUF948 domain-containing protein [Jiangella sp. DSM 45060]SDT03641.1 protein of unknown function [Jiangella sp. DSM 45060]